MTPRNPCYHCRHCDTKGGQYKERCWHPNLNGSSLSTVLMRVGLGDCGPGGKMWEPKQRADHRRSDDVR